MKTKMTHFAVALCAFGMFAGLSTPAEAWRAREDTLLGVKRDVRDLDTRIQQESNRLIEALRMQTAEGSAYADKQIEGMVRIQDAADMNATNRMRDEVRAQAESGMFDPSPMTCLLASLFQGGGGSGSGSGATIGKGSNVIAKAIYNQTGGDPTVQQGGVTMAAAVLADRAPYKNYSDATTALSILVEDPTIDLSSPDLANVLDRLYRNAINPLPEKPVTEQELKTPAGVARAAAAQRLQARMSSVGEVFAMTINMREPLLQKDGYGEYLKHSAYNRAVPDMISEMQSLDIRTVYHYAKNAEGTTLIDTMSERDLLKEIRDSLSILTRISYLSLEMQNRQALVDSLTLATLNDPG